MCGDSNPDRRPDLREGIVVANESPGRPAGCARRFEDQAIEHGIFFMPGSVFFADVADDVSLRLSVSNHTPDTIAEGMSRLAAAIAASPVNKVLVQHATDGALRKRLHGAAFLTTMPVMIGPASVFSNVKNLCSSLKSVLAT